MKTGAARAWVCRSLLGSSVQCGVRLGLGSSDSVTRSSLGSVMSDRWPCPVHSYNYKCIKPTLSISFEITFKSARKIFKSSKLHVLLRVFSVINFHGTLLASRTWNGQFRFRMGCPMKFHNRELHTCYKSFFYTCRERYIFFDCFKKSYVSFPKLRRNGKWLSE